MKNEPSRLHARPGVDPRFYPRTHCIGLEWRDSDRFRAILSLLTIQYCKLYSRLAAGKPRRRGPRFEDDAMDRIISGRRLPALRITRRGIARQSDYSGYSEWYTLGSGATHTHARAHTRAWPRAGGEAFNIHVAAIKTN